MNNFTESLNEKVLKIKFSKAEKSNFIQDYKPFIASTVEKYTGRYVTYGYDDELSIGLIAFEEAINNYNSAKGNFLGFAQTVIQRRLIDYYRKEKKHQNLTYLNDIQPEQGEGDEIYEYVVTAEQAKKIYTDSEINEQRKLELIQLKEELIKFGLNFSDVAKSSPKHRTTKKSYLEIVKYVLENKELIKRIKQKQYLPVSEIEEGTKIPRKTIERARNYVIAAIIILTGDYYSIREFIDWGWCK